MNQCFVPLGSRLPDDPGWTDKIKFLKLKQRNNLDLLWTSPSTWEDQLNSQSLQTLRWNLSCRWGQSRSKGRIFWKQSTTTNNHPQTNKQTKFLTEEPNTKSPPLATHSHSHKTWNKQITGCAFGNLILQSHERSAWVGHQLWRALSSLPLWVWSEK